MQQQKQQRAEEQRLPLTCTRSSNLGDLRGQRVITQFVEGSDDYQGYSPPSAAPLMASHLHHEARRSSIDDIDAKNILEMNAAGNPQASL